MNINSLIIKKQIPQYIAETYPRFLEFLGAYYDFLQEYKLDIELQKDVDHCSNNLLQFLKKELAARFPQSLIDERKFLRTIRELYTRKGTIDSIELLFRLFFNETIIIKEPNVNILKASDGKWFQNNFFTVRVIRRFITNFNEITGNFPYYFIVNNDYGNFRIDIEKFEEINETNIRLFYKSFKYLNLKENDEIKIYGSNGTLLIIGSVINSPSTLKIINGGKYWQQGQVFRIPGTKKDTIVRVTKVDNQGTIKELEIYEHGYNHSLNQIIFVSPFPAKPFFGSIFSSFSYVKTLLNNNGRISYHHKLILRDSVEEIHDSITGFSNRRNSNFSYFEDEYIEDGYDATIVLNNNYSIFSSSLFENIDPTLTKEKWAESQASIKFEQSTIVKTRGTFFDDSGQISNAEIKLQDNYFYQLFSYVIETETSIDKYKNILELIHPAGLKYFAILNKISNLSFENINSERNLFFDNYFTNALDSDESFNRIFKANRTLVSGLDLDDEISDNIIDNSINNIINETVGVNDCKPYALDYFSENYTYCSESAIQYISYDEKDYDLENYFQTYINLTLG